MHKTSTLTLLDTFYVILVKLGDLLITIRHYSVTGMPFLFHALACFSVFFLSFVLESNKVPFAQYFGGVFLLFEVSTLFLNICWFCDKTGRTGTKFQWTAGILLLITYFAFRVCFGTYMLSSFVSNRC